MSQPPYSSPDEHFPATGADAGSRPTQPEVPPMPPAPGQPGATNPYGAQPNYSRPTPGDYQPGGANFGQTSAPTWGGGAATTGSPWDQPSAQGSPYGTYATPYAQPQYPQYGQQLGAPLASPKKTLGVVALIFGLVASIGSSAIALIFGGPAIRRVAEFQDAYGPIDPSDLGDIDLSFFAPVRDSFLGLEVSLWVGSLAGIVAIVLGIIAIAQRKGRGLGIVALILGIVGPLFWAIGAAMGAALTGAQYY